MIIYNVTSKILAHIQAPWLQWMQQHHIPAVMATGCFVRFQLVRLLETDEDEGPTYAVQYFAETLKNYEQYMAGHATALRQEAFNRWGEQFIAFRSLMEVID